MTGKAAIVGGGVIGGGWAARFLLNGWDVAVFDPASDAARRVEEVIAQARRSLPALYETTLPPEGKLRFTLTLADAVAEADWVQESVPERLDLKHKVLGEVQRHAPGSALIGSSTSGFKPSELHQVEAGPPRAFVAHPFNPVYLLPLVELVGQEETLSFASETLEKIGMKPLIVRKEIDAHIADRLLEAVWREALWLIKDDIATTEEIDDAIRYGFGLRWAQMGLFETYRIAGGEDGMAHFIEQFGPCLKWPWTKLMDVPELDDALVQKIAGQSDQQSGSRSIRELERIRDDNLVAMMRALKGRAWGAGALLNQHDTRLRSSGDDSDEKEIRSVERVIPIDWTDYNGHMNESRYGQVFSDAADAIMAMIGADAAYVASGLSYFTVDTHTKFIDECRSGDTIQVHTFILQGAGKKLRLFHQMKRGDDIVATCNQLLIHVSLETRRSCEPGPTVSAKLAQLVEATAYLELPEDVS